MIGEPQLQLPELNVPTSAIYTGDNLDVLRGINSDCVDLIYLDPPFNSNKQYGNPIRGAFRDEWTMDDAKDEWVDSIEESHASLNLLIRSAGKIHGEAMQGYLTFMAVRLIEMRRVLKPAGSIYLHCDPTASHYLKGVMDSVFGPGNFRREIIWKMPRPSGFKTQAGNWVRGHDVILYYAKSDGAVFHKQYEPYDASYLKNFSKEDERGKYWLRGKEKRRLGEGFVLSDTWIDIHSMQTQSVSRAEGTGYPTQKPLALLERIIRASTNPGDVVLDPFCGCATACVAAETMANPKNAELPEKRRWIGIDVSPLAYDLVLRRLQGPDVGLREKGKASANVTHTGEVRHLTLEYEGPDDDRVLTGGDVPKRTDLERRLRRRSPNIKDLLYEMQRGRCNADAEFLDKKHFTLDHIVPQSKEGPDIDDNLQLLCNHHNLMKNNGTMADLDRRMRGNGETPWDNRPLRVAEAERDFAQPERKRRRARLV